MYNRRWYDKYTDVTETIDLMRNLDVTQQEILASDVTEIAKSIKTYHKEKEITPLSIGLERVFGLYQHSKARRWYDKSKPLNKAILLLLLHICCLLLLYNLLFLLILLLLPLHLVVY